MAAIPSNSSRGIEHPGILFIASDPGGAYALSPVMHCLEKTGLVHLIVAAYNQAYQIWTDESYEVIQVPPDLRDAALDAWMASTGASMVVCGTAQAADALEKQFILSARRLGLPSIAILDYWANYANRFSLGLDDLSCLPDEIAVMDAVAYQEMVQMGFPPEKLVITGQPAFDALVQLPAQFSAEQRDLLRQQLGIGAKEKMALFVSQPILETFGADPAANPLHPGFTQYDVIRQVGQALSIISARRHTFIRPVLRRHLREDLSVTDPCFMAGREWLQVTQMLPRPLLLSADLVIGMSSTLLYEASVMGCLILSVQPGLRQPETIPIHRNGQVTAVYTAAEIEPSLEALLFDPSTRQAAQSRLLQGKPDGRAALRVSQRILSILHLTPARLPRFDASCQNQPGR